MKQKVNDELKKHFRPEFLNRIDDVIVFHQLTTDQIVQMVDLMIGRVEKQLKSKDMAMVLTDKAKSLLAKRGFDPVLGARPLRRTIQREIEDALSEKILFDEIRPGQLITVDVDNWDGEGLRRGRGVHVHRGSQAGPARRAGSGPGRRRRHTDRSHGFGVTAEPRNGRFTLSGDPPVSHRWT